MTKRTGGAFVALATMLAVTMGVSIAGAATTPTRDAAQLAGALSPGSSLVTGASYVSIPPIGMPGAISTRHAVGFPSSTGAYAVMSTGSTFDLFGGFRKNLSDDLNGSNVYGDTDYDVSILKVDLLVPSGRNCMSFDMRMLSEEYPEFPGKIFNDVFIAELDINDWTTVNSRVIASHNFAFRTDAPDANGQPMNIRTTGATSATRANAGPTRFDGATPLLRAKTPIKPGAHSLYLSIFDQGDSIYNSAVFLDGLRAYATRQLSCPLGAFPIIKPVIKPGSVTGSGSTRIYRARLTSESGLSSIVVRLDGHSIYSRAAFTQYNRDIHLSLPVNYADLSRGVHTLAYRAENRAGPTTVVRKFRTS